MTLSHTDCSIAKLATGIHSFDHIAMGGLPRGRATLVSGTPGSAKTVFAVQFLVEGIRQSGEGGVFVTFEERPEDIRANMRGFGWDIAEYESAGMFAFVDAAPQPGAEVFTGEEYDLATLLARIRHAIEKVDAARVSIDAIGGLFTQFHNSENVRREFLNVARSLRDLNVTTCLTAERETDYGAVSFWGVEEFAADNVVILRNTRAGSSRRRTVEILKMRGANDQKGEFPFTLRPGEGFVAVPLSALRLSQASSEARVSSGIEALDALCGGGFFRDGVVLVSGATGAGKTLLSNHFLAEGAQNGETALLLSFEESEEQLFRNAASLGIDLRGLSATGRLRVESAYPETATLEDHLINIQQAIEEIRPQRVAVDSLSALERAVSPEIFSEFIIALTAFLKERGVAGVYTSASPELMGGASVTEMQISSLTDMIICLRYVEVYGELRRGLLVLKMRGSNHDRQIREFRISGDGFHIGEPFHHVTNILSGEFSHIRPDAIRDVDVIRRERDETRQRER